MRSEIAMPDGFEEDISNEQATPRYFIDLDWYRENNRSFPALARSWLCPKCRERLKAGEGNIQPTKLIAAVTDCCSKTPEFINRELPILASIFRLFLANGNQPLDLEELGKQLSEWRGGDTYRNSAEILSRLLANDRYYGLRQVHG